MSFSLLSAALFALALQPPLGLPVVEVPAAQPGHMMAVLISGDGGWAAGDRRMAEGLAAAGIPVAGLNSRSYFNPRRSPDETARDFARIARWYMNAWRRDTIVFVGYSRGADVAPFIMTRIPPDLRGHVALVAMVGLAGRANFEFHWEDLFRDVHRPQDLPTRPELEKLRGTKMLCLYGQDEKGSLCPSLDAGLVTAAAHGGSHVVSGDDAPAIVARILAALR